MILVYDRHTMKLFEVVPLGLVHNLPDPILDYLKALYQFIAIEACRDQSFFEKKICKSCENWCQPNYSHMSCVTCHQAFHLVCVGVTKALPKGFAWECVACQKLHLKDSRLIEPIQSEEEQDSEDEPSSAVTETEDTQETVRKQNEQYFLSEDQLTELSGNISCLKLSIYYF